MGLESTWPLLVDAGNAMLPQFPADYRRELEAAVKVSGIDRDLLVVANTMFDIKKISGCSSLIVEADHSATRGPLFGRNLDYPTLGYLAEYSLVVYAAQGQARFRRDRLSRHDRLSVGHERRRAGAGRA